jgi:ribulose-phosphate 3-epimerase
MPKKILIPAILAKDAKQLQEKIYQVDELVEFIQIDFMDGQFVKEKSQFSASDFYLINPVAKPELHMMVNHPEKHLEEWIKAGIEKFVIHAESNLDWNQIFDIYNDNFIKLYVALNPDTPINKIEDKMQIIDGITVMSVDPGKARQNFLPKVLGKIKTLRNRYPELSIQIDGGMHIGPVNTIEQALLAGANEIVCGSEIFLSTDIPKKIDQLYQIINK